MHESSAGSSVGWLRWFVGWMEGWIRRVKCDGGCCSCCYLVDYQRDGKGCVNRGRWKRFEMFKNHKMKLFLNSLFTLWLLFEFWNEFSYFCVLAVVAWSRSQSQQPPMVNSIKQQLSIDHIFLFIWMGNLFLPILNNIFHFNQFHLSHFTKYLFTFNLTILYHFLRNMFIFLASFRL